MKIGLIGGGNMARSLIGGLLRTGRAPDSIIVSEPQAGARRDLEQTFGIKTYDDNAAVAGLVDILVLAVKPQILPNLAQELAPAIAQRPVLVISIAAGINSDALSRWLGTARVVRTMPNTPALVGAGMTVLFAPNTLGADQRAQAADVMSAVGEISWIEDEAQMDLVTAISGSGPAYFFLVMEAMEEAARNGGLAANLAARLVRQTALGAALMAREHDPQTLRVQVTSPGGTTERALAALEGAGLRAMFAEAVQCASQRSRELADRYR